MATLTGRIVGVHSTWPVSFDLRLEAGEVEIELDEYSRVVQADSTVSVARVRAGLEVRVVARSDRRGTLVASEVSILDDALGPA